jgi:hypothetical protein
MLGGINGLVFGVVAEVIRRLYVSDSVGLAVDAASATTPVDTADFMQWYFIPLLSLFTFTGAGCIVHSCYARRARSVISLWLLTGTVAIIAWNVIWFSTARMGPTSGPGGVSLDPPSAAWADVLPSLTVAISSFCLMLFVNVIYGVIIQVSLTEYSGQDS